MTVDKHESLWLTWSASQGWVLWRVEPSWSLDIGLWASLIPEAYTLVWHYGANNPPGFKKPRKFCKFSVELKEVKPCS
jgi:hypothetical protein